MLLKQIKNIQCEFALGACPGNEQRLQSEVGSPFLFAGQPEFGPNKGLGRRVCYVFFKNSRPAALFLLTGWQLKTLTLSSKASSPVDIYSCSVKDTTVFSIVFCLSNGRIHCTIFSKALGRNVLEPLFLHLRSPCSSL